MQPPTYYSWGQGYMYIDSGTRYLGVSIAPFSLVQSDLWTEIESAPQKVRHTATVNVTAVIKSSYSKEQTTDFVWSVVGKKSGKAVAGIQYAGYGGVNTISGKCKIPAKGKDATFNISFTMPEEPVVIKFTTNKNTGIKELTKDNNTATYEIALEPYKIKTADYVLDYNQLTKEIEHSLAGGGIKAGVELTRENSWWQSDSNLTGQLNVNMTNVSKNNKQSLTGAKVQAGTNDPVNESGTSVARSPIIEGTIKRTTTGDDPLNHTYLSTGYVTNSLTAAYTGSVKKTYEYHDPHQVFSYTDSEGNAHYTTCNVYEANTKTGIETGDFDKGEHTIKEGAEEAGEKLAAEAIENKAKKELGKEMLENIDSVDLDKLNAYIKDLAKVDPIAAEKYGYATVEKGGAFAIPKSALETYADTYSDICSYENGVFKIINQEKFGEEVLSGVPLTSANGTIMIETKVPMNSANISMPSVANSSAYAPYFVSGGKLLSGQTEATIKPITTIINSSTVLDANGLSGSTNGIDYIVNLIK